RPLLLLCLSHLPRLFFLQPFAFAARPAWPVGDLLTAVFAKPVQSVLEQAELLGVSARSDHVFVGDDWGWRSRPPMNHGPGRRRCLRRTRWHIRPVGFSRIWQVIRRHISCSVREGCFYCTNAVMSWTNGAVPGPVACARSFHQSRQQDHACVT